jgi:hypothetical protein
VAETANPEVAEITARTGAGEVVAPGDVDAMCRCLLRARDGVGPVRDPEAIRFFSAPAATARLGAIFDEVRR